jgi:KDO2-lipid IV(A) lauroyltransferase
MNIENQSLELPTNAQSSLNDKIAQLSISLVGTFIYYFLPIRRQVIRSNIELVFQETLSASSKKRLAIAFYSHLIRSIKEIITMPFRSKKKLESDVTIQGMEYLLQSIENETGVILLTGHMGNWEFAPIIGIRMMNLTNQLYVIRKPIRTRLIESWLYKRCEQAGIKILSTKSGIKKIRTVLTQKGIIHFAFDQHIGIQTNQGIAVPFFNRPAGTYRSLSVLAHRTKAIVLPMSTYRLVNGKHVLKFHPQLEWQENSSPRKAIYNNTLRYNQVIENIILDNPEQWWWVHQRWKI